MIIPWPLVGLSLAKFMISAVQEPRSQKERQQLLNTAHHVVSATTTTLGPTAMLTNDGPLAGSSVVFVWFAPLDDRHQQELSERLGQAPPRRILASYTRSRSLSVGEAQLLDFHVRVEDLCFVDISGARVLPAGEYLLQLDLGPKPDKRNSAMEWAGEVRQLVRVEADIVFDGLSHGN